VLDAAWWRRHAHLVRDPDDYVVLSLEPGTAREVAEPDATPVSQDEAASSGGVAHPGEPACGGLVNHERRVARLRGVAADAKAFGKAVPHVLLAGAERTLQATLARVIAAAAAKPLVEVAHPGSIDRLAAIGLLASLAEGTVLFVEEAQALPRPFLAVLLEALARGQLALELSDGARVRRFTLRLPAFTLVAGTPDAWAMPEALRACFGLRETLQFDRREVPAQPARPAPAAPTVEAPRRGAPAPTPATPGAGPNTRSSTRPTGGPVARPSQAMAFSAPTEARARRLDLDDAPRGLDGLGREAGVLPHHEQRFPAVLRTSPTPPPIASPPPVPEGAARGVAAQIRLGELERCPARWTRGGRLTTPPQLHRAPVHAAPGMGAAPNVRRGVPAVRSTP
jgi:hypothetical protein